MSPTTRSRLAMVVSSAAAAALLAGGTVTLAAAAEQRSAMGEAREQVRALRVEAAADRTFTSSRVAELSREVAAMEEAEVEAARAALVEALEDAAGRLESSRGKVLDEDVRAALAAAIEAAEGAGSLAGLDRAREEVAAAHEAVDEAVEEWRAEQRRREAERRRAEEAALRSAAQRQAASHRSASPAGLSSSSSSGGGSRGGGGVRDVALAALARHGCGSVPVYWDDPRLAGWNGAAMIGGNEQILLNSRMPVARAGYVAAHECAHILQSRAYGHDLNALGADLDRIYGGNGVEQNADCITQRWGYGAWNYTRSCGGERGAAAAAIASGNRAS